MGDIWDHNVGIYQGEVEMQAAKWLCHHQKGRNSGSRASSEHGESCRRAQAAWEDWALVGSQVTEVSYLPGRVKIVG